MNRDKIQRALADVHLAERTSENRMGVSRDQAVTDAVQAHRLSEEEEAVLRSVTHTPRRIS